MTRAELMESKREQTALMLVFPEGVTEEQVVALKEKIKDRLRDVSDIEIDYDQVSTFNPDWGGITLYTP